MHIAVIGGGASGLCAMRYIVESKNKFSGIVFEQADSVGGTWLYTEYVGKDRFGLPVNTSMYKNLRTNLPKEAMQFPGFPFKECKESYVHQSVVFDYLNEYADKYNIRDYIKLNHFVKRISKNDDKWNVVVTDLIKNADKNYVFDAVIICNGHNSLPSFPKIEGMETFPGFSMHSHDYRTPEQFKNQTVLIIGAGPSGIDIAYELCHVAEKIVWSHHSKRVDGNIFPSNVYQKVDLERINGNEIKFKDGTTVTDINSIIYCTGFKFSYPFLDESCGISVDNNYVYPLYKHMININHPTMCFTGIPKYVPQFPLFDIQIRYYLKLLNENLPEKEKMTKELIEFEKEKIESNTPKEKYHILNENAYKDHFDSFAIETDLEPIPEIVFKLHNVAVPLIFKDFKCFRDYAYKITGDNDFEVHKIVE